ncbi:hypothetical protein PG984_015198 [Apiospora sp. TS-2023a]
MSSSTDSTKEPCNFNKLPPELRLEIWKLSVPQNNVLLIGEYPGRVVTIPPPTSAWVCQESRAIAFQHGKFYLINNKQTWFSPEFDRVALDKDWIENMFMDSTELRKIAKPLLRDVRHVLASPIVNKQGKLRNWAFVRLSALQPSLEVFPNLQSIGIPQMVLIAAGSSWSPVSWIQDSTVGIPRPDCSLAAPDQRPS